MDSKALRYFYYVATLNSFTEAAKKMHIAQPAISMAIRKLEDEIGVNLINRGDRKLSLTDAGTRLLHHAKIVTQQLQDAALEIDELKGLSTGSVTIGIPSMIGSYFFPPILMAFRDLYPGIQISIVNAGSDELTTMILNGELDISFAIAEPGLDEVESIDCMQQQIVCVVSENHQWASEKSIAIEKFLQHELTIFKPGYYHRRIIDDKATETGITPQIAVETNLVPVIKSFVRRGFGVTCLLECVIAEDKDLIAIPFEQPFWLGLRLIWRKEKYLSHANNAFRQFIMDKNYTQVDLMNSHAK